jgi:transcription-repair coupling factor (superfamily II helicase)
MSSSLALRSLFKALVARDGLTTRGPGLHGLTLQAKALAAAAASHEQPGDPVLVVVPTDAEVDGVVGDVRFFLGAIEGLSDGALGGLVLPLPSLQVDPYRALAPHMRVSSARARALLALATGNARVIVMSAPALLPRLPEPGALVARSLGVKVDADVDPQSLAALLTDGGYDRHDPVEQHGEFCLRGGILDVYPPNELWPIRIEFMGDMVESIRRFDPDTQRSVESLDQFMVVPVRESTDPTDLPVDLQRAATVFDYLSARKSGRLFISEPDEVQAAIERVRVQVQASYEEASTRTNSVAALTPPDALFVSDAEVSARLGRATRLSALDVDASAAPLAHVPTQPIAHFRGRITDWITELRERRDAGDAVIFVAHTAGRAERTLEMLKDYDVRAESAARTSELSAGAVLVTIGGLSNGVRFTRGGVTIYAETDLFDDDRQRGSAARKKSATAAFLSDLRDLKVGDLIVHVDNGIGEFVGLKQIGVGDSAHEFLELRYHGDDKLFVPVERLDLVQKYTGGSRPALDRLGGTSWAKAKTRVKKAMRDMAEELLKLYAARKAVPGHAFSADTHWQEEFEAAFPWDLTVDQASAVADIKRDMESSTPMDRLLCGDVGYGKTEVAMRAAFKSVMDGKQVAILAPTTVLAFQHHETLKSRFASFPVRVDMVSRFRRRASSSRRSNSSPAATSTSWWARTACCRRTWSSATSACSSWTRSSASAWRTRNASSRCARRWTC